MSNLSSKNMCIDFLQLGKGFANLGKRGDRCSASSYPQRSKKQNELHRYGEWWHDFSAGLGGDAYRPLRCAIMMEIKAQRNPNSRKESRH